MKICVKFIKKFGAFLCSFLLCSLIIGVAIVNKIHTERITMEQLVLTKSTRLREVISRLIYKTNSLSALALRSGTVEDFSLIAANIVDDPSILYVLIAPGGVVSDIYPTEVHDYLLGMDLLNASSNIGVSAARLAKNTGQLVLGGPFELTSGRKALLARLPLFTDTESGGKVFWGLVSVALEYPEVMSTVGLDDLQLQGFAYEIYSRNTDTGELRVIAGRLDDSYNPNRFIEQKIDILNAEWCLRIYATTPWYKDSVIIMLFVVCACFSALVAKLQSISVEAKKASKAKSEFLASMSHEIRTPMNAIIGMSELLVQENLTERQYEYANDIRVSSTALLGIINDILDVSKIEAGKLTLTPENFNLKEFVENVYSVLSYGVRDKNIEFISETVGELPGFVFGDDLRLRQILLNLLGNSVKFTEKGFVKLVVSYSDGIAHFIVSDSGVGIKEEDLVKLYDSFEQFDSKKNRGKQGTGLGLSITKSLVNMMGGEIHVTSVYGKGTSFVLDIPLPISDSESVSDYISGMEAINIVNANVLLVEDNAINRKVADGLFRHYGIECDMAENGLEAVKMVQSKDYDIVFMDHMMPEMDGIEATVEIRSKGGKYALSKLPIIALTANVLPESREQFSNAGMNDFLAKPIDKVLLKKALKRWLPASKIAVSSAEDEKSPDVSYTPALNKVASIDGMDVPLGLSHVSGMDDYERSLRMLKDSIPETLSKLDLFINNGELDKFAIDVHGMKGALAICGNMSLSEMARKLEMASKDGDAQFCKEFFPEFSSALESFKNQLSDIFSIETTPKTDGDSSTLIEALSAIEECIENYNRDDALTELENISHFSFGNDIDPILATLTVALENFDFDVACELMQEIEL